MAIQTTQTGFCINGRFHMNWADIPISLQAFLASNPGTLDLEARGRANPVANPAQFVRDVCLWGGKIGPLIATKVQNNNPTHLLTTQIALAKSVTSSESALSHIRVINHLGISFGSKQLRMLNPKEWCTYDKFLEGACHWHRGETPDARRYPDVCKDFQTLASHLTRLGETNPIHAAFGVNGMQSPRGSHTDWWTADVEVAVFWAIKTGGANRQSTPKPSRSASKSIKNNKNTQKKELLMSTKKKGPPPAPPANQPTGLPQSGNRSDLVQNFIDWVRARNAAEPITGFGRGQASGGTKDKEIIVTFINDRQTQTIRFTPLEGKTYFDVDVNDQVIDQVFWTYFSRSDDNVRYTHKDNSYVFVNNRRDPYIAKAVNAWAHR